MSWSQDSLAPDRRDCARLQQHDPGHHRRLISDQAQAGRRHARAGRALHQRGDGLREPGRALAAAVADLFAATAHRSETVQRGIDTAVDGGPVPSLHGRACALALRPGSGTVDGAVRQEPVRERLAEPGDQRL
ncbi:hypothetical protein G6F59_015913 [Rhizopus arrhizus]|nr:hypothetical protein G6F59_015913 [Rhizopus arrhizus]